MAAEQLDAESLMLARQVLPQADDVNRAEAEMDARLAARGAGGYGFTGPTAGLFMAMQGSPGVSMMSIDRKRVVSGKSVSGRVGFGGCRILKNKNTNK